MIIVNEHRGKRTKHRLASSRGARRLARRMSRVGGLSILYTRAGRVIGFAHDGGKFNDRTKPWDFAGYKEFGLTPGQVR